MTGVAKHVPLEARQRPPGFLLAPFGWATQRVIALLQQEPGLLADLLHLSRIRMHLIAFALAHVEGEPSGERGLILFRGSAADILDAAIGCRPVGLKRAFRCLPSSALEAESYRRLVQLLDDPAAAKLLYHAGTIDGSAIKIIDGVPAELRSVVFAMQSWFRGMESLADGLRCLVRRGAAASFDSLVADLNSVRQPEQFIAKIKSIVEALPLPDALPPVQVGQARRLDQAAELRNLVKRWCNCLESYLWRVDGGECAIYLWEHAGIHAVCAVRRRARLGWFLNEVKGPHNDEIEPPQLDSIVEAFDAAGMPSYQNIKAIEDIVDMVGVRGLRRRRCPRRPPVLCNDPDGGLWMGFT
jgi:hypothetical protein